VRTTPKKRLREVDFIFDGQELRGLEQNPQTSSRWAQFARAGHKVMQFRSEGRYVANLVDGKVTMYGGNKRGETRPALFPWECYHQTTLDPSILGPYRLEILFPLVGGYPRASSTIYSDGVGLSHQGSHFLVQQAT
jgi:hypothetical protein